MLKSTVQYQFRIEVCHASKSEACHVPNQTIRHVRTSLLHKHHAIRTQVCYQRVKVTELSSACETFHVGSVFSLLSFLSFAVMTYGICTVSPDQGSHCSYLLQQILQGVSSWVKPRQFSRKWNFSPRFVT